MKAVKMLVVAGLVMLTSPSFADGFGFAVGGYYNTQASFSGPTYSAPVSGCGGSYRCGPAPVVTNTWFENIGIQRSGYGTYHSEYMQEQRSRVWGYQNMGGYGGGWDNSFQQHMRFR